MIEALVEIARLFPPERLVALVEVLRDAKAPTANVVAMLNDQSGSARHERCVGALVTAWRDQAACPGSALALALETLATIERHERERVEIVWTGPATELVQARHTSAVLFELIAFARKRLTLASFSSYPIAGLIERLQSALDRGVHVELLLESSYDSNGRLTFSAEVAFAALARRAVTYAWPRDLRPLGALMHAKFLIVDETAALITSANLTENGIDRNLELGVLIRNGLVPKALAGHVDQLIAGGTLRLVSEIR